MSAQPQPVGTYHCICGQLACATSPALTALKTRSTDQARICAVSQQAQGSEFVELDARVIKENEPVMLRMDDGFEPRYLIRCVRCSAVIGYQLDQMQVTPDAKTTGRYNEVVYLLEAGLLATQELAARKLDLM